MNTTRELKKQKAIELMQKLGIYKPYIKGFKDSDKVCFFENFGGFWAYQEPDLMKKLKTLKKNTTALYMRLRTNTLHLVSVTILSTYRK